MLSKGNAGTKTTEIAIVAMLLSSCIHPDQSLELQISEDSIVKLQIPNALLEIIEDSAPGFLALQPKDFDPWVLEDHPITQFSAPFAAIGDFNEDGLHDLVALGKTGRRDVSVTMLSSGDSYRGTVSLGMEVPDSYVRSVFIRLVAKGDSILCSEFGPQGEGGQWFTIMPRDGYEFIKYASVAAVYIYEAGAWKTFCGRGE